MRILVVEDQKKMLGFLAKGLTEAGYSVDTAESASAALSLASDNDYDLIILDVMLPDQSGLDTARSLRADGFQGGLLMLTALSGTKDKVLGLDSGADDYLSKPFAFAELLARVRALLRRKASGSPSSNLRYSDLEIDRVQRKVTRGGTPISVTAREFALLSFLVTNAERALSRTEIIEHVWDIHFDHNSNVIDVYINMLRKKVDAPFATKLIHTVIGFGYVLKEESH